jgi:hypothetical protein
MAGVLQPMLADIERIRYEGTGEFICRHVPYIRIGEYVK